MKYAVLLYGLVHRSLGVTYEGLRSHVMEPLGVEGGDVFFHSWDVGRIRNPRAGESVDSLDKSIVAKFLPEAHGVFEPQDEFDESVDWAELLEDNVFRWDSGDEEAARQALFNYVRALESLRRAWVHFRTARTIDYDGVVVARPDLNFLNRLRVPELESGSIWVPEFHSWGGTNDRFALGGVEEIECYCARGEFAREFLRAERSGNPERILKRWLDLNGVGIKNLDLVFQRVRGGGGVSGRDRGLFPRCQAVTPCPVLAPASPGENRGSDSAEHLLYDAFVHPIYHAVVGFAPASSGARVLSGDLAIESLRGIRLRAEYLDLEGRGILTIDCADRPRSEILALRSGGRSVAFAPQANGCKIFRDRRVVFGCLNGDESIGSICDWVEPLVSDHGADALLLYSQASSENSDAIVERVSELAGVERLVLVCWGPGVAIDQGGAIEHARWRFLLMAKSVLWCEHGAMLPSPDGGSVFDECEASVSGHKDFSNHGHRMWGVAPAAIGAGELWCAGELDS